MFDQVQENNPPIYVTRPFLPELAEFKNYLDQIWDSRILTNAGPLHEELEAKLAAYLGVKYVSLFSNGTLALITALQTLKISGDVITTPFSFAATTHSLFWNNIRPVFCDIEPNRYTLDPEKIERCITPETTAILPVHVYGNPCRVDEIERIASKYGLKIIYDAAHAFGVKYHDKSILNYGNLSILSFHATKIFNTFEGGAIISHDKETKQTIDFLKNHGFSDETTIVTPGFNAKMNEVQAAMGLIQLKTIDERIAKLKEIANRYRMNLSNLRGVRLLEDDRDVSHNYSYFPILIDEVEFGVSRNTVYDNLKEYNIFTRRYFYPLISDFAAYKNLPSAGKDRLPTANKIAEQVLCMPNYADLTLTDVDRICNYVMQIQKKYHVKSFYKEAI